MLDTFTGICSPLRLFSISTDDDKVESSTFRPCFRYFPPIVPSGYMVLQRCLLPHRIKIFLGGRRQLRDEFSPVRRTRSLLSDKMGYNLNPFILLEADANATS